MHVVLEVQYLNFQLLVLLSSSPFIAELKCKMTLKGPFKRFENYNLFDDSLFVGLLHAIFFILKMHKSYLHACTILEVVPGRTPALGRRGG